MKGVFIFSILIVIISCSESDFSEPTRLDEEETPTAVELLGTWYLDYYQKEENIYPIDTVCNAEYTPLYLNFLESGEVEGNSHCNGFFSTFQNTSDSIVWSNLGITLAECAPLYSVLGCETDGNDYETDLIQIIFDGIWGTASNTVHYTAFRYNNNIDTLTIFNSEGNYAKYYRTP